MSALRLQMAFFVPATLTWCFCTNLRANIAKICTWAFLRVFYKIIIWKFSKNSIFPKKNWLKKIHFSGAFFWENVSFRPENMLLSSCICPCNWILFFRTIFKNSEIPHFRFQTAKAGMVNFRKKRKTQDFSLLFTGRMV